MLYIIKFYQRIGKVISLQLTAFGYFVKKV